MCIAEHEMATGLGSWKSSREHFDMPSAILTGLHLQGQSVLYMMLCRGVLAVRALTDTAVKVPKLGSEATGVVLLFLSRLHLDMA